MPIYIMKIAPYDPVVKGLTKYDSLKQLTMHDHDPGIDPARSREYIKKFKLDFSSDLIICSDLKRARETIGLLLEEKILNIDIAIEYSQDLREIKFDLEELCSLEEYLEKGSDIVRGRFLGAFIDDRLAEKRYKIKERIDKIIELMRTVSSEKENILLVSHTFFLKIFQIYLLHPDIFENPQILRDYVDPNKRIMDFLQTAEIRIG